MVICMLFQGGFARCYELLDLNSNKIYAGKIISKTRIAKPHQRQKVRKVLIRDIICLQETGMRPVSVSLVIGRLLKLLSTWHIITHKWSPRLFVSGLSMHCEKTLIFGRVKYSPIPSSKLMASYTVGRHLCQSNDYSRWMEVYGYLLGPSDTWFNIKNYMIYKREILRWFLLIYDIVELYIFTLSQWFM